MSSRKHEPDYPRLTPAPDAEHSAATPVGAAHLLSPKGQDAERLMHEAQGRGDASSMRHNDALWNPATRAPDSDKLVIVRWHGHAPVLGFFGCDLDDLAANARKAWRDEAGCPYEPLPDEWVEWETVLSLAQPPTPAAPTPEGPREWLCAKCERIVSVTCGGVCGCGTTTPRPAAQRPTPEGIDNALLFRLTEDPALLEAVKAYEGSCGGIDEVQGLVRAVLCAYLAALPAPPTRSSKDDNQRNPDGTPFRGVSGTPRSSKGDA